MKKLLATLCAAAMLWSVTACTSSGPSSTPVSTPNAPSSPASSSQGEAWPKERLTVIVPWKSGGGADSSARLFAKYWEEELGVPITIENREGGDSTVGSAYYFGQTQDMNTILMQAQPFLSSIVLSGNVEFGLDAYSAIGLYEVDPSCLAVMPDSGYTSIEALDAAIKANPGAVRFGVNGGSTHVIMMNLLIDYYGWDVKTVYYDGASESRTALMGGHVDVIATTLAGCTEEIPLIIGADQRNPAYPDIPTYTEITGEENVFATTRMFGVSAEAKENYPDRYQKLTETFQATFENPAFVQALEDAGRAATTSYHSPEDSAKIVESQHALSEKYWDILSGN